MNRNGSMHGETKHVGEEQVEYEIIFGNETIVFLKTGAYGTVFGQENKYFYMAQDIHQRSGATVICASNPDVSHEEIDEQEIRRVIKEMGISHFTLHFIGVSDGAYHNLSLAKRFPQTVKMVGINSSYITVLGLQEKLLALPNVCKVMIYGTKDDDFDEIVPALHEMTCDNLTIQYVEGADHRFTGMVEEFIGLADYAL